MQNEKSTNLESLASHFMISVDWLSICGRWNDYKYADMLSENKSFTTTEGYFVKKQEVGTKVFSTLAFIYKNNLKVAELTCFPRSSALKQEMCIVKIDNRILYCQDYVKVLYDVCKSLCVSISGLSRLDLCYDCLRFKGEVNPQNFIRTYLTEDFESAKYISHSATHNFTLYGHKANTSNNYFKGIKFYRPTSKYSSYMYNKTKELEEVKDKPWIRESWQKNGLEIFDEVKDKKGNITKVQKDIWRAEVSIKAEGKDLLNMATGELFKLDVAFLQNQKHVEKLFYIYAAKVFDFRRRGKAKRTRDFEKVELFEQKPEITTKPVTLNEKLDCGRSEKTCYNKLQKIAMQYASSMKDEACNVKKVLDFLERISDEKIKTNKIQNELMYLQQISQGVDYMNDFDKYLQIVEDYRIFATDFRMKINNMGEDNRDANLIKEAVERIVEEGCALDDYYQYQAYKCLVEGTDVDDVNPYLAVYE